MMVGTLQLSRALADQQLADQILEEGIQKLRAVGRRASDLTSQPRHQRCCQSSVMTTLRWRGP
jgi:hypothetical protein